MEMREFLIQQQDDRNKRIKKTKPKQRKKLAKKAVSVFQCTPCKREAKVPWSALGKETPLCKKCGGPLFLVTAMFNKGVLPKL